MRFLTLTILTCGVALAAGPQTVTYVDGTLAGLAPNSGATLQVDSRKLALRAGAATFEIPMSGISKVAVGQATAYAEKEPLYKVWTLHKRLLRTEVLRVQVDYKAAGEQRTLQLDMEKPAADDLVAAIDTHQRANQLSWWGDRYWKTSRNKTQWGGAGEVAARE